MSKSKKTILFILSFTLILACERPEEEKEEFPDAEDRGGGCAMCKPPED